MFYHMTSRMGKITCIKIDGLQILVMLWNAIRNNVAYIWQNVCVFTQKRDLKVVLGP